MKQQVLLFISIFATTSTLVHAQDVEETLRFLRSPMGVEDSVGNYHAFSRARWNGNAVLMGVNAYFLDSDAKTELGLSDEQWDRLEMIRDGAVLREKREQQDSTLMSVLAEVQKTRLNDDPLFENANQEQIQAHSQALQKLVETNFSLSQQEIEKFLTTEQMQLLHLRDLQLSAETGLPTTSMYEVLGLSDPQRAELAAIRKTMEPEFEKILQEDAAYARELHQFAVDDLMKKHNEKPFESLEEIEKYLVENENKRFDSKSLKKIEQMEKRGQNFTNRLKTKMLDVLTDEQLDRMKNLLAKPSAFVQKELQKLREDRLEREKLGQWKPGPDSWKPGDPIPEEYLQKRKESRFPKKSR